jgi:hypothetical protein
MWLILLILAVLCVGAVVLIFVLNKTPKSTPLPLPPLVQPPVVSSEEMTETVNFKMCDEGFPPSCYGLIDTKGQLITAKELVLTY